MPRISRLTLNQQVYAELRTALMAGQYAPGEVLTIRGLEKTYGISATPIREALKALVAERALTVSSNRSIAVATLTRETFDELRQIRGALEGLCAEIAAAKATGELVADTRKLYMDMERAVARNDVREYLRLNETFHRSIYNMSKCGLMVSYIEGLWVQVGPYFRLLFGTSGWYKDANGVHREIVEALESGNVLATGEAIRRDINTAAKHVMRQLEAGDALSVAN